MSFLIIIIPPFGGTSLWEILYLQLTSFVLRIVVVVGEGVFW